MSFWNGGGFWWRGSREEDEEKKKVGKKRVDDSSFSFLPPPPTCDSGYIFGPTLSISRLSLVGISIYFFCSRSGVRRPYGREQ